MFNWFKQRRAARIYRQAVRHFQARIDNARAHHKATKDIARARQEWLHAALRGDGYAE